MFKDFGRRLQRDIKRIVDTRMQANQLRLGHLAHTTQVSVGRGGGSGTHGLDLTVSNSVLSISPSAVGTDRRQCGLASLPALRRVVRREHVSLDRGVFQVRLVSWSAERYTSCIRAHVYLCRHQGAYPNP